MLKFQSKFILFIALILVLIKQDIFAYEVFVNNKYICEKQKGIWREFGNDCANICDRIIEVLPICTNSVAMFSCDCGKNKCWDRNNEECIPFKEYKALVEKEEEERKKIAEEKKKKEEENKKLAENKNIPTETISTPDPSQTNSSTSTITPIAPPSQTVSDPNADFIAFLSQTCKSFGGQWKNFGNSCAGTCEAKVNNSGSITCNAIASDSCDCGEDKCWYQNKCIKIEEYKQQKAGNNSDGNNNSTNSNDAKINPTDNTATKAPAQSQPAVPASSDKSINNIPALPEIEQKNKTN